MSLTSDMLEYLTCPQCRGKLHYTKEDVLVCTTCRLCFPVDDGIPLLTLDQAMSLSPDGRILPKQAVASFLISSGPDQGVQFSLHAMTCKAIGRRIDDVSQTQVFTADFNMSFDEQTKKIIGNYLGKTKPKIKLRAELKTEPQGLEDQDLGAFKRLSDLILSDQSVSRLHAMLFYDESGVGILDLVSRNGTYVNGREVEAQRLAHGDEISIGQNTIQLEIK